MTRSGLSDTPISLCPEIRRAVWMRAGVVLGCQHAGRLKTTDRLRVPDVSSCRQFGRKRE